VTKSNALESLVIAGFVRGLSTRDVENTLADALGTEAALSKSTVSRVCQAIAGEFTAWSERRLDDLELDYLFLRDAYWTIFDTDDLLTAGLTPGPELVAAVQHRIDTVAEKYARAYPAAVKCLLSDREQLTSYLRFPVEHHKRIRHSNFIERTFGETRRRVKVIGRLPGEASCLNLVWAVLDRASRGWRGMTMTPAGTRLLADLRRQLLDPPTPIRRSQTDAQVTTPESVAAVA
jgi:transposase-like protein